MKTFILTADVGTAGVTFANFVKQDGAGGVVDNDGAATAVGYSNATKTTGKVGVIKNGLATVPATVAAAYNFGDALELAADGQTLQALASGTQVGIAAETKTTATGNLGLQALLSV